MAVYINGSEREVSGAILRDYLIAGNRTITLTLNEERDRITFSENDVMFLDSAFEFIDHDDRQANYLLSRMYAPITQVGLGKATLLFFKSITGATVWARRIHDQPTDGSHLTGDAPSFVARMIDREILIDNRDN